MTQPPLSPFSIAVKKAKYGHRPWLVWGWGFGKKCGPLNRENLKAALMESGTQEKFTLIHANCGTPQVVDWSLGLLILRNLKFGTV